MVRDKAVHEQVIEKIRDFVLSHGFTVLGLTFSPVKGPEGNIEYLIYLQKAEDAEDLSGQSISALVEQSHNELSGGDTH